MKKSFALIGVALVAMVIPGCQKEKLFPDGQKNDNETIDLKIVATTSDVTKTYIYPVDGGFMSSWSEGDCITLGEQCGSENFFNEYYTESLQASDIVDGKAIFNIQLTDQEKPTESFRYLAVYPSCWIFFDFWESETDEWYQVWTDRFGYTGEYVAPHMQVEARFSDYQSPTVESFDSNADILVSRAVETVGQPTGQIDFQFARLGNITKITLDDLDLYKGSMINRVIFRVGKSYGKSLDIIYDPILERYAHRSNEIMMPEYGDMETEPYRPTEFFIEPRDVFVKEDGTADIWLRTYAGELTDEFTLDLYIDGDGQEHQLRRTVNLFDENRTIRFEEGKMTIFSVGSWKVADVPGVYEFETEINADRDGFTVTWAEVENASGYACVLLGGETESGNVIPDMEIIPVDNGDGTWTAKVEAGLPSRIYYLSVSPIPAEGHALMDDYPSEVELRIGVPTYWMLAHDSFGSVDSEYIEGTDNENLITLGPGKVRYKNLSKQWQSSWQALVSSGPWFFYTTESLNEITKIQLYSKDDSHLKFEVYASKTPGEKTVKIDGNVIEVSEINVGSGSYHYEAVHKLVEYVFPEGEVYGYFTVCGEDAMTVLTSQYSNIYYFE